MEYVVKTSAARMPGSCKFGKYGNVAVLLVDDFAEPKMISERAVGVHEIVDFMGKLNVGSTENAAFQKAVIKAEAFARTLNGLNSCSGGVSLLRRGKIRLALSDLTNDQLRRVRVTQCADEKTGQRFGKAKCRAGKCSKIGSGGRNKGQKNAYQIWVDWS